MDELTERQVQVYEFMRNYKRQWGTTPSCSRIGDEFGISKPCANAHVQTLVKAGLVRKSCNGRHWVLVRTRMIVGTGSPVFADKFVGVRGDGHNLEALKEFKPKKGERYRIVLERVDE